MNLLRQSRGVAFVVRGILRRFHPPARAAAGDAQPGAARCRARSRRRQRDGAHRRRPWWPPVLATWASPGCAWPRLSSSSRPERRGTARQPVGDDGRRPASTCRTSVLLAAAAAVSLCRALHELPVGWKGRGRYRPRARRTAEAPAGMAWWKVLAPFAVVPGLRPSWRPVARTRPRSSACR